MVYGDKNIMDLVVEEKDLIEVEKRKFSLEMETYLFGPFNLLYCHYKNVDDKVKLVKMKHPIFSKRVGKKDDTEVHGRNLGSFLSDVFEEKFGEKYLTHRTHENEIRRDLVALQNVHTEKWHFNGLLYLKIE